MQPRNRVQARLDVRADGPFIVLSFDYNSWLVTQVKTISIRKYDPETQAWVVPYAAARWREITSLFGGILDVDDALRSLYAVDTARERQSQEIKLLGSADIAGYTFADPQPFNHQRAGLAFLAANDQAGLLWEMGSGKTRSTIDDICYRKFIVKTLTGKVLVFCPNEVKYTQWQRQIPLWSNGLLTVEVLDGTIARRRKRLFESEADVLVLNVESALYLSKELLSQEWGAVILDEATRFKNPQAQRTKTILKIRSQVKRILTGTPITNSPIDVYAPFSFLNPALFGSWWSYMDRYLVTQQQPGRAYREVLGFKNLDELGEKLKAYSYRVLKEDVLDLPEKTYADYNIELEGDTLEAYLQMRDRLRVEWETTKGEQKESKARIMITQLLRLSQISGGLIQQGEDFLWLPNNPKQKFLTETLGETIYAGNKAVVWCVFRREIEELAKSFAEYNPVLVYGDVPLKERAENITRFQDKTSANRLFIGQMHSGGIGIDLTAARFAWYYTRNFSLEDYLQSQDRLHRIGQTGTVNIGHLIATLPDAAKPKDGRKKNTSIDQVQARKLIVKQSLADTVTGDRVKEKNDDVDLVNEILGT